MASVLTLSPRTLWLWISGCALMLMLTLLFVWANTAKKPPGFGEGRAITPCESTRLNCISSLNADPEHRSEALQVTGPAHVRQAELLLAIRREHYVQVVFESKGRVDVTFRTPIFRFPDDVEFALDGNGVVHFRSQSRVGSRDFGVNRARIERIRARLAQKNAVDLLSF
jgi:uncharacterized protein (DUF1499 family)